MNDDLDLILARLAEQQHGVFDTGMLRRIGFTDRERDRRVNDGRWLGEFVGVYRMAGAPSTRAGDCSPRASRPGPEQRHRIGAPRPCGVSPVATRRSRRSCVRGGAVATSRDS